MPYVLASYYECDVGRENMSDELTRAMAAVYDRHMAAGHISSYGWSAHAMGGNWRRLGYFIGSDRGALLDMWNGLDAEMTRDFPAASRELNAICGRHTDYLWRVVATSSPDPARLTRGDFTISTYYGCNMVGEERADELVKTLIGPAIDVHVKAGHLASWSWLSHDFGAGLRRVLVMDGPDSKTLFTMRDAIIAGLRTKNQAAMNEFSTACGNHQDYLWARVLTKP
jgi:hypothetical protein